MVIDGRNINLHSTSFIASKEREAFGSEIFKSFFRSKSDSLDLSMIFEKYAKANDKTKAEIMQMLADVNNMKDNVSSISAIHSEMQKILRLQINGEKQDIERFNSYCDERTYYENLLESDGEIIISEGKYDFGHFEAGETVSREAVENALADVQKLIDKLVTDEPYEVRENRPAVFKDAMRNVYNQYVKALASATGIRSEYLNAADESSLLFDRSGRTEENFVQKASERIDYLQAHSECLKEIVEQYHKVQKLSVTANLDDFAVRKFMIAKLNNSQAFEQQLDNNT